MPSQRSFLVRAIVKLAIGVVVGLGLVFVTKRLDFPPVFQTMFFIYGLLGAAVFILLDAPSLKPIGGVRALLALALFYVVLSAVYIAGATWLPQYDPEDEMGKITKILEPKIEKFFPKPGLLDEQLKTVHELEQRVKTLTVRLNEIAPPSVETAPIDAAAGRGGGAMTLVERGKEVYELHECYNCHKVGGKGGTKKRGPVLDNVGNLLTIEDFKKKIFDPTYLYAEGFEKEHKKGMMPDKYKDLMSDEELEALAAYLSTLKNPAVETPRPVFVKTKVEHGFIVYGYIRDANGKGLAGVEVQAKPLKEGRHGASAKTNPEGYYEIFMHMHNEDAGTKVLVSAQGAKKEIVATYDPSDKVTKRQAAVDLVVS